MIIPDEIINKQLGKIVVYNLRHSWLTTITHLPHRRTVINYNAYYFPSKQNKNKKVIMQCPLLDFFLTIIYVSWERVVGGLPSVLI